MRIFYKAGAQRVAAQLGIALIIPDTSPRGDEVPDEDRYDFGKGAGFYLNATETPWAKHYQMYDYILDELPKCVEAQFPLTDKRSIAGHSMGGHGALVIGVRNPERYQSISAFSPITHPTQCPWGEYAFTQYLGGNRDAWKDYDAVELIKAYGQVRPIRVDQGLADTFSKSNSSLRLCKLYSTKQMDRALSICTKATIIVTTLSAVSLKSSYASTRIICSNTLALIARIYRCLRTPMIQAFQQDDADKSAIAATY